MVRVMGIGGAAPQQEDLFGEVSSGGDIQDRLLALIAAI